MLVSIHQTADSAPAADIAFRFLQRLSLASAERLERLFSKAPASGVGQERMPAGSAREISDGLVPSALISPRIDPASAVAAASALELVPLRSAWPALGRLRDVLGRTSAPVAPARSLGEE